ncbi:hypothetical protein V5O48_000582 [Marasmius crinis-equi]|uniref:Zinc finger PHD-type domain-containing protein n=1 Tax=Marasmius crinis-equi TaxID=585013 RepID=A0ABR3G191_9AGAR
MADFGIRFPKRNFRCDCPTDGTAYSCSLHKNLEPSNTDNVYGQNFQGLFCRCKRPYDAATERETMIQCLVCEDWFHESCCNLRERPSSREQTPEQTLQEEGNDDDRSEASSSGLPPPLLKAADYDAFVCFSCVSEISILQRYAGTPGCLMVVRDDPTEPWRVMPSQKSGLADVEIMEPSESTSGGQKRPISPSSPPEQEAKRQRLSPSGSGNPCLVPTPHPLSARIYAQMKENASNTTPGTGDLFFTEGFRDRFCRCPACLPCLEAHRCLLEEEETYEPPNDPDSGLSLEELGMRALSRIPRDRAIDGIHAFNAMREDLVQFLRPFAQDGTVVSESDVKTFFDNLRDKQNGQGE